MREKDKLAVNREAYDLAKNSEGFLSLRERVAIVGWMQQYCARAELSKLTFSLSLVIFDNVINSMSVANNDKTRSQQKIEALAVCSLFIACKVEEVKPPSLSSLVLCVSNTNTLEQLVECESQIFKVRSYF